MNTELPAGPGTDSVLLRKRIWSLRVAGESRADLDFVSDIPGYVRSSIHHLATSANYDIQLNQTGYEVGAGGPYRITFRARAHGVREVGLGFSKGSEPWSNLGLYRRLELTPE